MSLNNLFSVAKNESHENVKGVSKIQTLIHVNYRENVSQKNEERLSPNNNIPTENINN